MGCSDNSQLRTDQKGELRRSCLAPLYEAEPGQPAEVPLGADVRPRPEYDEEVFFLGHPYEGGQVEESGEVSAAVAKVEHAALGLVEVPGNVAAESRVMSTNDLVKVDVSLTHLWRSIQPLDTF